MNNAAQPTNSCARGLPPRSFSPGLAYILVVAGLIGLVVTLLAMQSRSYRALSQLYETRAACSGTGKAAAHRQE